MSDEEKKQSQPQEEQLPGAGEATQAQTVLDRIPEEVLADLLLSQEGDPRINEVVPKLVGSVAFPKEPDLKKQYVDQTTPILEILSFHTCCGPVATLSPGVRLIASLVAIVGGVVLIKVEHRKEKEESEEETPSDQE